MSFPAYTTRIDDGIPSSLTTSPPVAAVGPGTIVLVSRCAWTLFNFRRGMITRLLSRGWRVVACGSGGDGFEDRVRALGCEFVPIRLERGGMNPLADLRMMLELRRLLIRERPAVVHCFTIKPVIFGILAARLAGVPRRVATITGLGYAFASGFGLLRWLTIRLYRLSMRFTDHVFFQNSADLDVFKRLVFRTSPVVELVPGSGVNLEEFQPRRLPSADGRLRVLLFGRMLWDKGIGEFVEAARAIRARRDDVVFSLVGDPDPGNPKSIPPETLAAWAAEKVVEYSGAVDDVRPTIAAADVVVLPSFHEGLPRVLLEAAAMGKPLVASDIPGCRAVVEPGINGFLVPVRDAGALTDALARVLDSADWREQAGRASRQIAESRFSENVVIDRALLAYAAH